MINQHNLCCQKLIHISRPETHDDDMQIFNKRTKKRLVANFIYCTITKLHQSLRQLSLSKMIITK